MQHIRRTSNTTKNPFQQGFTLIELIIVIVILGILTVVAVPRFLDLSEDGKIASLEGMKSAMLSASNLVYSKAVLQGLEKIPFNATPAPYVDLDGDGVGDINTHYGIPSRSRGDGIVKALDSSVSEEWTWSTFYNGAFVITTADIGGRKGQYINNTSVTPTNCYVRYDQTSTGIPDITLITSGC
ncbi:prepilin-type N-terminal cleavage/methylation domain-containing protein [Alteromonas sp. W364]|uniref:prepilin-type N-terminal cleavage/methylation domain-containing protein n=1 Tax=Alteromonas sp. W364 TaxID=3075610 RepID=UPI002888BED6|nr:prepilin-type N-terminal cleavage/methylation domain-containing protein [Alteromonas sp. W364]MDT0627918.1 prepilin-type N-terminal cleavage/methylation domain-containing protein [Alteromonas sp. W364]